MKNKIKIALTIPVIVAFSACSKSDIGSKEISSDKIEASNKKSMTNQSTSDKCVDAKISQFKKEMGDDHPIKMDLIQEWEESCSTISNEKSAPQTTINSNTDISTDILLGTAGDGGKWYLIDAENDGNYRIPLEKNNYFAVMKITNPNNTEKFIKYQVDCHIWQIRGIDTTAGSLQPPIVAKEL